ncbi:hypothetical protein [Mesorhizobium sp.]|uniref:hypothetical protein n=1 Tax=Mesorhizobium sp. TaxID=1871066 RepID=UPI000FE4B615|nr:hypothetical protein [Mesorhizobium sp.]RWG58749.1 MAG: hypothetical protein EOQ64_07055 [Mesorhizobium sp.]RWH30937.1 MAG: hypothetical protein EOQ76_10395 [Mesorhizobium sp.]RWH38997.1 MAG: hypothetical protein EOQ79_08995 [Mesorhizobium sp.]RWH45560.1 MAG: hypothetical protein EOQ78_06595 [Mesorhizobium sp.]RWI95536.1 MAG: hypothetical protein EOR22_09455 [Mesorhizobium sp.]
MTSGVVLSIVPSQPPAAGRLHALSCNSGHWGRLGRDVLCQKNCQNAQSPAGYLPVRHLSEPDRQSVAIVSAAAALVAVVCGTQALVPVAIVIAARSDGLLLSISRTGQAENRDSSQNCITNDVGHLSFPLLSFPAVPVDAVFAAIMFRSDGVQFRLCFEEATAHAPCAWDAWDNSDHLKTF